MRRLALVSTTVLAAFGAGCGSSTKTVTVAPPTTPGGPTFTTLSGPTTPTTSTPATTTAAPVTPTTTAAPPPAPVTPIVHLSTFRSPSSNIGCIIIDGTARCDIKQRSWSPPPTPKSCPPVVNFGQGLVVSGSGPGLFVCAGDTALDPTAQPLPYGTDTIVGSFRCSSRTSGMTCTKTDTGHGFFISIQSYRTF